MSQLTTCTRAAALTLLSAPWIGSGMTAQDERALDTPPSRVELVLEGYVLQPDGAPSRRAVVLSSAGGRALTDDAGRYELALDVPLEAEYVQLTAVGASGADRVASRDVAVAAAYGRVPVAPLRLAAAGPCEPAWRPTFGERPGTDEPILALAVHDDGRGPALFAGGDFTSAGGVLASRIARWGGSRWSSLGSGITGRSVHALASFDDGSGPALYAAGDFTSAGGVAASHIARWDGASWSPVGSGTNFPVYALAVHDDGNGPALYAGGQFGSAGGVSASRVARWDGTSWSRVGAGTNDVVLALESFDDGNGPALYAGGWFSVAGAEAADRIARWDGTRWSAVGGASVPTDFVEVRALAVHDDGGGPALFAGANYFLGGGLVARWDGASWSSVGTDLHGDTDVAGAILALRSFDDGSGAALHAAGSFTTYGGGPVSRIARWTGTTWAPLGAGVSGPPPHPIVPDPYVAALAVYDPGAGAALHAGGFFEEAGGAGAPNVAAWDGADWSPLGNGLDGGVGALAEHDDGTGTALYAGGQFEIAGGVPASRIARWDGSAWIPLASGISGGSLPSVSALASHDDGTGPALYAGGSFTHAGGVATNGIARWDGATWAALGSGVSGGVRALVSHDDGRGSALFAGGAFPTAGGVTVNHIARWDGTSWSSLGSGIGNGGVRALAVFDDGGGPALYAGGNFASVGGVAASNVARWDGSSWTPLASGTDGYVTTLAVHGSALYAGGVFAVAGGVPASRVARWDGTSWTPLASGTDSIVQALLSHDDGRGSALFAGGSFTVAGGVAADGVARWDGASWTPLGGGMARVFALAAYDDGSGRALHAGGLWIAFDSGDAFLARWGCAPDTLAPVLDCPPVFAAEALGGPPGEVVHFAPTATDDRDPAPVVACVPPSGSFFPRGTTLVTCTATDASGNQSTAQFPVTVLTKARPR
jgi:hypothetical protein